MSGALDKLIEAVHAEVEDQRRYLDDIGRRLTGPVGVSRAMKDATGGLNRLLQRLEVLEAPAHQLPNLITDRLGTSAVYS
jgi:hypothetical protein